MEGHQPRQVPPHKRESDQDSLRPLTAYTRPELLYCKAASADWRTGHVSDDEDEPDDEENTDA